MDLNDQTVPDGNLPQPTTPPADNSGASPIGTPPSVAPAWVPPAVPVQTTPPPADTTPLKVPAPSTPAAAEDSDLIEKEWVIKAKQIVEGTRHDPYEQTKQIGKFKADYMKKRYNKIIGPTDD